MSAEARPGAMRTNAKASAAGPSNLIASIHPLRRFRSVSLDHASRELQQAGRPGSSPLWSHHREKAARLLYRSLSRPALAPRRDQDELDQLRRRRKVRAYLSGTHLSFSDYLQARARTVA